MKKKHKNKIYYHLYENDDEDEKLSTMLNLHYIYYTTDGEEGKKANFHWEKLSEQQIRFAYKYRDSFSLEDYKSIVLRLSELIEQEKGNKYETII